MKVTCTLRLSGLRLGTHFGKDAGSFWICVLVKNTTFTPICEAAATAASSNTERLMPWSPTTSAPHVVGDGGVTFRSFCDVPLCDKKVVKTSVKMSVITYTVLYTKYLICCLKLRSDLSWLYTIDSILFTCRTACVRENAVRVEKIYMCVLYRSTVFLNVQRGHFAIVSTCIAWLCSAMFTNSCFGKISKRVSVSVFPVRPNNFRAAEWSRHRLWPRWRRSWRSWKLLRTPTKLGT